MNINANTKIAAILKQRPDALEAIISLSPKFNKLRNPTLRKLMAARTSIVMASKIGGCSLSDFFEQLEPFGFIIDRNIKADKEKNAGQLPDFMNNLNKENVEILDVRPVIKSGNDPFNIIMQKVKELKAGTVLKLVNTFEPVPLIIILSKQGFEYFAEHESENLVSTYFYNKGAGRGIVLPDVQNSSDWDKTLNRFEKNIVTVDVRQMEMPQPMLTIIDELERLPDGNALFVYHKRIPVFLLPELQERKFEYRIKEISDGEVHLLIFR